MLTEIYCPLFKTNFHPTGKVTFHPGLNVILGSKTGITSIGKSTMLLIIDYAFGGDTYTRSDAVKQLGNHTIYFNFCFNRITYSFSRNTEDSGHVNMLDKNTITKTLSVNDFSIWLAEQYHFRNTISRFFRIYGKNNYNERQPLQIRNGAESQKDAINVLITLFDKYKDIAPFKEQLDLANNRAQTFNRARKYELIPSVVTTKKAYGDIESEITSLKKEKQELESGNNGAIDAHEIEKADHIKELKRKLYDARKKVRQKENDLHLIDLNLQAGCKPTEADLHSLGTFFPDTNLEKLTNIEIFHNKIQSILRSELLDAQATLKDALVPLNHAVNSIQMELESIKPSMAFSEEFLEAYSKLDRKIHQLETENKMFITKNALQAERKQTSERWKENTQIILHTIEKQINIEIEKLSDQISLGKDNAPLLRIPDSNHYTFETPKDTGTGTNYKGMLIYDLSILNLTALPALAHDSLLFPYVSDMNIRRILELYSLETEKQIFIAFDHYENYGEQTTNLLKKHTVLTLDAGENALFGRQWGKREANETKEIN
jgi:hypothetical protein